MRIVFLRRTSLIGHLHWDHTQGLPFLSAGVRSDASVTVLLPEQGDDAGGPACPERLPGSVGCQKSDQGLDQPVRARRARYRCPILFSGRGVTSGGLVVRVPGLEAHHRAALAVLRLGRRQGRSRSWCCATSWRSFAASSPVLASSRAAPPPRGRRSNTVACRCWRSRRRLAARRARRRPGPDRPCRRAAAACG